MSLGDGTTLGAVLTGLATVIDERALSGDTSGSYTAKLLAEAPHKPAKKLGEEAVELALALVSEDNASVKEEAADVLYHFLVALRGRDISLGDVADVLAKRQGLSGLVEKANRPDG